MLINLTSKVFKQLVEFIMWLTLVVGGVVGYTITIYTIIDPYSVYRNDIDITDRIISMIIGIFVAFIFNILTFGMIALIIDIREKLAQIELEIRNNPTE